MKAILFTLALLFSTFAVLPASSAFAADSIYTARSNNIAVGGYDAVSFFSEAPEKGAAEFSYEYSGAEWHFVSQSNLDKFMADPAAFAPQYGGHCAWAVAKGKLVKGSPKHWDIVDGKLYLNYNRSVKRKWSKDIQNFIISADNNWPEILEK